MRTVRELRSEMWLESLSAQADLRRVAVLAEETPLSKLDREAVESALVAIEHLCNRLGEA